MAVNPKGKSGEAYEACLQMLKQRYADRETLPVSVAELSKENPDLPVRRLNEYLLEKGEIKAEHYYIRNHILLGRDTDRMEFTFCMMSFEKTVWGMGDKQFSYLAGGTEYASGDIAVAELGFSGRVLGEVKEVIHCLGIDAPWPVSQTKTLLRKATPDEIAAGEPCLTAEEQGEEDWPFDPGKYRTDPPGKRNEEPEEESADTADLSGFVPAEEAMFRSDSQADLRESHWEPCEFRFRGLLPEIAKLKQYLKQNGIWISAEVSVSDRVREIRVIAYEKTMDLIEKFPALKVTGLAEHWFRQQVYVMYSESGFRGITKMQFGGSFDRRHDGGDGRWEWEYDMMEPVNVCFTWLQTGGEERVSYRYPFGELWKRACYVRERDGTLYIPDAVVQTEYSVVDGVLEEYFGNGGDMVIPDTVKIIQTSFCDDPRITSVYIPGTVSCIPSEAFMDCKNLRKVTLGEGVESICSAAFEGCDSLTELTLPTSLTYLGSLAFNRCSNLDVGQLRIPDSVQLDSLNPFSGCKNQLAAHYNSDKTRLLRYNSTGSKTFAVPETVREIAPCAFQLHMELESVILPEGLKEIGDFAFDACRCLQLTSLPDSVERLGQHIFKFCDAITELALPLQLQEVPSELFTHFQVPNKSLKKLHLKENVRIIRPGAFLLCQKLESIELPAGIEEIGEEAFQGCASLRRLELPAGINSIGKYAFRDCTSLKEMTVPGSVKVIPEGMFCNCAALETVVLEEGVTQIYSKVFAKCKKLREVYIPASLSRKIRGKIFDNPAAVTIRGKAGSLAEAYAKENGIRFVEG